MILGERSGSRRHRGRRETWSSWYNQPTAQMYHVAADYRFPYWADGFAAGQRRCRQSSPAAIMPRSRTAIGSRLCAGGESGYTAPDPLHPEIVFGGTVTKCNVDTGETMERLARTWHAQCRLATHGRCRWFFPRPTRTRFISPISFFSRPRTAAKAGRRSSPDMTREDPGVPPNLDEATAADAPKGKRRGVIYSIAPSPLRASTVWIGTDDGLIHMTDDDGKTWTNVTPPELTPWSKVVMLDRVALRRERGLRRDRPASAGGQRAVHLPHSRRRQDLAKITNGLPPGVYMQNVKEDTVSETACFSAAPSSSVFVSFDDGDHWQSLQLNLPRRLDA